MTIIDIFLSPVLLGFKIFLHLIIFSTVNMQKEIVINTPHFFLPTHALSWYYLETELEYARNKNITINVEGNGGSIVMVVSFAKAIDKAIANGNRVQLVAKSYNYSGHAFLLCLYPGVIFEDKSVLMFHAPAFVTHVIKTEVIKEFTKLISDPCVYYGYMSKNEQRELMNYKEVWQQRVKGQKYTYIHSDRRPQINLDNIVGKYYGK